MSFEPTPKQALILWKLLITQEMPVRSKLSPELKLKELKELEQAGLISLIKRKDLREQGLTTLKGTGTHIVLDEERVWDWAVDNFNVELYQSKYTKSIIPIVQSFLTLLEQNLQLREISLSDFLRPQTTLGEALITSEKLEERIREAYLKVSGGSYKVRVRLSELRKYLNNVSQTDLDRVLGDMELAENLVLMQINDPQAITNEDKAAAIDVNGQKRHIVYMNE